MLSKFWAQYQELGELLETSEDPEAERNFFYLERRIIEDPIHSDEDATVKLKLVHRILEQGEFTLIDWSFFEDAINHLDTKKLRTPLAKETALSLDFPTLT